MDTNIYKIYVQQVYDGDTITCDIDLGFGIKIFKQKLRLFGINAPEMRGEQRPQGIISRDALREKILDKNIILKTIKNSKDRDTTGKYGRWLSIIYLEDLNINEWLVENNYAVKAEY